MRIEYIKPETVDELDGQHFQIYNPDHNAFDDWHYEYGSVDEAISDFRFSELKKYVEKGYVLICKEELENGD